MSSAWIPFICRKHGSKLLGCLALLLSVGLCLMEPARSAPSASDKGAPDKSAPSKAEIEKAEAVLLEKQVQKDWITLRAQVGSGEFYNPSAAIERYQQFYEQCGNQGATTAIKVASLIAQMHKKLLNNPTKALEIYDRALGQYGHLPESDRLKIERERLLKETSANKAATLVVNPETANPARLIPAPALEIEAVPSFNRSQALPLTVNGRLETLASRLFDWRSSKITLDQWVKETDLTPLDALQLLASPHLVSGWIKDAPLRARLASILQASPDLLRDPTALPLSVQFAVGEYDTQQKDARAELLFQNLLQQNLPEASWLTKMLVAYRLADYYGAVGQFEKAAQAKLQIKQYTQSESWVGNAHLGAARYLTQAGQTARAQEHYREAEKSGNAWIKGIALYDKASVLIAQDKHDEAREILKTPVQGEQAEQIKIALSSLLARSYYLTGEMEQAKQHAAQAVAQAKVVKLLANEGLEFQVESAQSALEWSEHWEKTPIVVEAGELSSSAVQGTQRLKRRLIVRTQRKVPLVIASSHPQVTAQLAGQGRRAPTGLYYEQDVLVEVQISAEDRDLNAVLTVSSPEIRKFKATAPLRTLITAETKESKVAPAQIPQEAAGKAQAVQADDK